MKINLKSIFKIAAALAPIVLPAIPAIKQVIRDAKAEPKVPS
jgi:hypothetical protein